MTSRPRHGHTSLTPKLTGSKPTHQAQQPNKPKQLNSRSLTELLNGKESAQFSFRWPHLACSRPLSMAQLRTVNLRTPPICSCTITLAVLAMTTGAQTIVPGVGEGNSNSIVPFGWGSPGFAPNVTGRYQQVYSASAFGTAGTISAVSFRLDQNVSPVAGSSRLGNVTILLGVTPRPVDGLERTFLLNVSLGQTTMVYSGPLAFTWPEASTAPRPFSLHIPLQRGFFYNPAQGNLLLDIIVRKGNEANSSTPTFDAANGTDAVSRVFASSESSTGSQATTGTPDTIGLVTQFTFAKVNVDGVSNNASGARVIQSGSWVSIYGTDLAATTRTWQAADFQGTTLPTTLDGVSVKINGKIAPIYYISPTQVNVQAPTDDKTGTVQVDVTSPYGTASSTAMLQSYAPGFYTFRNHYIAAVHTDGTYVAPEGYFGPSVPSRPAKPGDILLIFGTGFGPTTPPVPTGQVVNGAAPLSDISQMRVCIAGTSANVLFGGIVAAGQYQFNIVVPAMSDGDQTIIADIAGTATQAGLLLPIKN